MIALTFCVHPEYGFDYPKCKISRESFNELSNFVKPVEDALDIVNNLQSNIKNQEIIHDY